MRTYKQLLPYLLPLRTIPCLILPACAHVGQANPRGTRVDPANNLPLGVFVLLLWSWYFVMLAVKR
jgi:hypothetical protein